MEKQVKRLVETLSRYNGVFFLLGCAFMHTWIHATVTAPVYSLPVNAFLAFSISTGTLLGVLLLIVVVRRWLRPFIISTPWLVLCALLSSVGTVLMSKEFPILPVSPVLTVVAIALTAVGTGGLLTVWGESYTRLKSASSVALLTFGALVASFLMYLVVNSFPELPAFITAALLPIASVISAALVLHTPQPESSFLVNATGAKHTDSKLAEAKLDAMRADAKLSSKRADSKLADAKLADAKLRDAKLRDAKLRDAVLDAELAGSKRQGLRLLVTTPKLMVYIFAFSVPLNFLNLQISARGADLARSEWSLVYSCALLALLISLLVEILLKDRNISVLSWMCVLFATGGLLLYLFSSAENHMLMYILMYAGYYLFVATFYTLLGQLIIRSKRQAFVIFAAGNVCNVLGLLAGSLMGLVADRLAAPWTYLVSIFIMYALFFIGFIIMGLPRKNILCDPHDYESDDARDKLQGSLEACVSEYCAMAATQHDLSLREQEICAYLVRGRSVAAIAKALTLSPNTVKSHVNHLYQKLDVHSREELIILIEAVPGSKQD